MGIVLLGSLAISSSSYADQLNTEQQSQVKKIIQLFKYTKIPEISQHIQYPLQRETPIPAIQNAKQMQTRFHQVFDQHLIEKIASSTSKQWSSVGWRGVMLDDGIVWLNESQISAVNYQSAAEKKLKAQLLAQQKQQLHASVRTFKQPELQFKTSNHRVRIDLLSNGQYRYASWKNNKLMSTPPDLVLNQGRVECEGSGGNHAYLFKSGQYQYRVDRNLIGADDSPEVSLSVTKGNQTVLNQVGHLIQ
ncbi:hypothetical protein G8D99_07660 [Acinetobacter lanii]|uniref:Uncharacterized protein n=1 Tax=Acinetobacter lanii TaxID=2715163 RepID=A0A6G8S8A7_9GAMM|nr:hypothetical protein G8D99_07660 [Acinetobacter lanii]